MTQLTAEEQTALKAELQKKLERLVRQYCNKGLDMDHVEMIPAYLDEEEGISYDLIASAGY